MVPSITPQPCVSSLQEKYRVQPAQLASWHTASTVAPLHERCRRPSDFMLVGAVAGFRQSFLF